MGSLSLGARAYTIAVLLTGAGVLVAFAPLAAFDRPTLFILLLFFATFAAALRASIPLPGGRPALAVSFHYVSDFLALLLVGPHEAMLVAVAGAWSRSAFRFDFDASAPRLYRTLFNMACQAIGMEAAGQAYLAVGGAVAPSSLAGLGLPLAVMAVTYAAVGMLLPHWRHALAGESRSAGELGREALHRLPGYLTAIAAAALLAPLVGGSGAWLAVLTFAALYLTYRTYRLYLQRIDDQRRRVEQVSDVHLAALEALALAVDAKDRTTDNHIRREQRYAEALARDVGMSEHEIQGVKTAALLHDIGKLAVPEHILSKPGPLTHEEFQKVRIHPQVGADIIARVPFPYPVAPLILSHHERWDGKGYPSGLKADAIPLGARILGIVDYFEALTSDRPYHRPMPYEAAIALLKQEAGRALDPMLVQKFIELLPALHAELEREAPMPAPAAAAQAAEPAGATSRGAKSVFDDIALAHREIYALYEIAQAMGTSLGVADTMTLIASKLRNLVPFSSYALFLYDEEAETLSCRFASGVDAPALMRLTIQAGHGLAGWVARNRRALVNARPSADFEAAGSEAASGTLQSALVSPLVFNDRLIGTLSLYHTEAGYYGDDHRRLLSRVCEQAAAVIHHSIVFEQTQVDSLTDALTGLPNTRFMFVYMARELARAERLKSELSLLVMDLDNFKQINDSFGHQVGDRALREVARLLRAAIRPYDICVRYAGDEFIVVLSDCDPVEAEQKRLELQRAIEEMPFEAQPGTSFRIGMSAGAAVFPHDGGTYEMLLAVADSRMYRDKTRRKALPEAQVEPAAAANGQSLPAVDIKRAATEIV